MIQLHTDCLVFKTSDGETIPCSAQDVTVELLGDAADELEPHMITEAAEAILFHFKVDLGRSSVSVGEFTMALERILRGFGFKIMATGEKSEHPNPAAAETDLHESAKDWSWFSSAHCAIKFTLTSMANPRYSG